MNLLFDLNYAWRLLKKSWGYSLMCASVVALSVGLAVWTYALGYSLFFKPLGFPGSDRWYSVQISPDGSTARARPNVDAFTYQELLKQSRTVNHLGAFSTRVAVLSEGQATTSLRTAAISPRLLAATGVLPQLGRIFGDTDGQAQAAPVAILSHDAWQNYFAGDRSVVGKTARIDAAPVQIVGVLPKGFYAFQDYELWVPLQIPVLARPSDSTMKVSPIVRLGADQDIDTVLSEINGAIAGVNRDYPGVFNVKRRAALIPTPQLYTHSDAPIIAMLGLMALAVLLLGCVNISMVFLARLLERSRELALRTALGASRGRLLRQCLLETAVIVLAGLVVGYGFAALGIRWALGIAAFQAQIQSTGRMPYLPEMRLADFAVAVVVAIVVWMLSTLIPAWRISKQDAAVALAGSGKGTSIRGSNKSVRVLVGLQVLISCLVLVVCGNVVLAVNQEVNRPTGLDTSRAMISTLPSVLDERYADEAARLRYWEDLATAVRSRIPGAEPAFVTAAPTRPVQTPAVIETRQESDSRGAFTLPLAVVSENYFDLLGLRLRTGRLFDSTDNRDSLKVAVVDEHLAARHWPGENVIGKRIQLNPADNGPWLTIVGAVSSAGGRPYSSGDRGVVYQPLRQAIPTSFHLLVKLPNAASSDSRAALRAAAFSVDRDLPLHNLQTLDDYLKALRMSYQAMVPIMVVIALITGMLAASGLFGLISRSVAQRTQDVGILRALGATRWRATSMFYRQGAAYVAVALVSVALGIMMMPALSAAITNIFDHVVLGTATVVLLMGGVIFAASYIPTRRAIALEPGDALRYE
ncbi:MAG TPA: ABC transporter permease [Thermoanaerobaculia bacterium]|nr:ABC transporter permease [Thermoanaerobaculia bacterium]